MAKLDADQIKELCLNNFEKVIFGVLVLFFLMMVFSATKVKPYAKKPDQLNSACEQARSKFEANQEVQPVVRNYETLISSVQEPIPATDYSTAVAWNPILSKEGQKRRSPKALEIKNLVVKEWHGSVQKPQQIDEETGRQIMDDGLGGGRNSTTMGVRCCIILGEIPYLEQEEEFQTKLGTQANLVNGMNPGAGIYGNNGSDPDAPYYHNYIVERAEVPADGNMENLVWVNLHKKDSENEKQIRYFNPQSADGSYVGNGGGGGMDLPEKYRPPQLWRRPSNADKTAVTGEDGKTTGKTAQTTTKRRAGMPVEVMGMDPNGMSANGLLMARDTLMANLPQVAQNGMGGSGTFNWALYLPYSDAFEFDVNSMYGDLGMGRKLKKKAKDAEENSNDESKKSAEGDDDDEEDDEEDEDVVVPNQMELNQMEQEANIRLFRYVDYTVKEGKQYVYRVRLTLHNPNYQHEPAFTLENPDDAKTKYLESPYSNVTHPVAIPLDRHFYVQGFSKFYPRKAADKKDPKIKKWSYFLTLLPVKYNPETGNEDFTFFKQLAPDVQAPTVGKKKKTGLVKKEEPIRIMPGQQLDLMVFEDEIRELGNMENRSYNPGNRFDDEEEDDREQKRFTTQFVLLDFHGGQELYEPIQERDLEGADEQIKKDPSGIYSPASVLLIGPKGELIIQSELEDVVEVYRRRDMNVLNEMQMEPTEMMNPEQDQKASRRRRGKKGEGEMPPVEPKRGRRNKLEDRL